MTTSSQTSSGSSAAPLAPATYIVAETPEVLARLMRENDGSMPPAWAYVAPASPTNTFAVGGHSISGFDGDRVATSPTGVPTSPVQGVSPPLGALGVAAGGVAAALEAAARGAGLAASNPAASVVAATATSPSVSTSCSATNIAHLLPSATNTSASVAAAAAGSNSNSFNVHLQQQVWAPS